MRATCVKDGSPREERRQISFTHTLYSKLTLIVTSEKERGEEERVVAENGITP